MDRDGHLAAMQRAIERERSTWEDIEALAELVAETVERCPQVWQWGDGFGGAVMHRISEAVLDRGFSGRPNWQPSSTVERLANRDGWECAYCATPLGWGNPLVTVPQVEHALPRSRGGSNRLANLVLSCRPCNDAKGTMTADEFLGAGV